VNVSEFAKPPEFDRNKFILGALLIAFLVILIRTAWLCDDAYISFRVVDNFINGYGLVWNIAERVQVFTHPLWVLLISAFYIITGEVYFTVIILSIVLALAAAAVVAFRIAESGASALLAWSILFFSAAFIEYSTSGLENPLTFFLLSIFFWLFFKKELNLKTFLLLSFTASLIALNRLDTLLLCLPALIYVYTRVPKRKGLLVAIVGFLPLVFWFIFSLIYYGFPLPNTYYAKLHTGIDSLSLTMQGLQYFTDSLQYDPITLVFIIVGIVLAFRSKSGAMYAAAIGVLLYLGYIVKIGGDFMSGRFFAAPLLISAIVISVVPWSLPRRKYVLLLAGIAVAGLVSPGAALLSGSRHGFDEKGYYRRAGIENERAAYYKTTGLLNVFEHKGIPDHSWYRLGEKWRKEGSGVQVISGVGFVGFAAGPDIHIVDGLALTDPLLARLPVYNTNDWRIGHFRRMVPPGYVETIATSQNKIDDANLAVFFDKIRIITSGNLLAKQRWVEIFKVNFEQYDYLIEKYLSAAVLEVAYDSINTPKVSGTMWKLGGNTVMNKNGLRVRFDQPCHAQRFEISVDNNDKYRFVFKDGLAHLAEVVVDSALIPTGGLRIDTLEVPDIAAQAGFDTIEIHPSGPDECYSIGHIRIL